MANPHVVSFLKRLEARYSVDADDMTMSQWIEKNTRLKKLPFSFRRYAFQRAIVDDMHPNMGVKKCSQVGLTEVQIRKMLGFLRRNNGTKGIFTLPNEKMFKRVSKTRIQPLLQDNKVFSPEGEETGTRSMDLMQFDQSFLFVTGATEGDATSIDADIVFNDEVDLTDQSMLALFNSRMQNSDWKISQRFSTPTFMDYGIDLDFQNSDQHEYLCKCVACGHHNIPDFAPQFLDIPGLDELPEDVLEDLSLIDVRMSEKLDLLNAQVVCEKCRAPLDLDNPDVREWVPRHPERSQIARGYNVLPFCTSRLTPLYIVQQLIKYKERDYIRGWYNTVLGRPYTDANARLTESAIRANFQGAAPIDIAPHEPAFIGIDVGQTCHVTPAKMVNDELVACRFLEVPATQIVDWVKDFRKTHNLVAGAMDRHPYTPTAEAVWEASGRTVFPVEYRGSKEINPVKDPEGNVIYFQANRTMLIDSVARLVRSRSLPMAGYGHHDHVVVAHLRDMVRDEQPEEPAEWKKLTGNDHYFHALGFLAFSTKIKNILNLLDDSENRIMALTACVVMKGVEAGLIGHANKKNHTLYRSAGSLANSL